MMSFTNRDPDEIHKFSDANQDWWNPTGPSAPLHHINPLRLEFIQKNSPLHKSLNILDIGCGGGILTEALAQTGAHVTGIDLSESALKAAHDHKAKINPDLTILYHTISTEEFAENNPEKFDMITCMEMLEHVPDPQKIIQAASRLLKPGGKLFLSTLNRTVKSYLFSVIGAEYLLKLLPIGTHDYGKFIKPSELSQWVRQAGLSVRDVSGITYNPFFKKYSLVEHDISVNYIMFCEKNSDT